jgi:tetratricopeptide (TPR) repeat protein
LLKADRLRITQWILAACGLACVALLYLFADLKGPQKPLSPETSGVSEATDFAFILPKALATLTDEKKDSAILLERSLNELKGEEKINALAALGQFWTKTGNIIVAGKYYADAANLSGNEHYWQEAATRFYFGFQSTSDSMARSYAVQQSAAAYETLTNLDSTNIEYGIQLAQTYIDGEQNVMKGVLLLRKLEAKDSSNINIHLLLGRLAIVSGQTERAISRFEKVIGLNPQNSEAYYYLAEAYRVAGNKEKAISNLEILKGLVTDPQAQQQIDQMIIDIKNS